MGVLIVIRFLNVLLAALVAGTVFGIFIGYNPVDLTYSAYVEQQQLVIGNLKVLMPVLVLITILLTGLSAYLQRSNKGVFLALLLVSGYPSFFICTSYILVAAFITVIIRDFKKEKLKRMRTGCRRMA